MFRHCHRLPAEGSRCAARSYFRFSVSQCGVEEGARESGIVVTYETIRHWCNKFGIALAQSAKAVRPSQAATRIGLKCF